MAPFVTEKCHRAVTLSIVLLNPDLSFFDNAVDPNQ